MTAVLVVDVTGWVRNFLAANLTLDAQAVRVATKLPADLAAQMPFARPRRTGGPDDGVLIDIATITTDWLASDEPTARRLAYAGCGVFRAMVGQVFEGAVVSQVRKLGGPFWVDYDNPAIARHVTTHQVRILAD